MCSKQKRLSDSQLGEMDINLCLVDAFSSEVCVHLLHLNTLVVDGALGINKETVNLARDGLE